MTKTKTVMDIEPVLLTVDHTVQRPLDTVRVNAIAADFRRDALGVVTVSERGDGTHHVVDGQHRLAAAHVCGQAEEPVTCVLWRGLSLAEEAAMFRFLNNTRRVEAIDKFRVRIIEGDLVACKLNALLADNGWTIGKAKQTGNFAAVNALENVYRTGGGDAQTCESLITVATQAWGHNQNGLRAEVVSGLGVVLRRHPGLDMAKLITELAKHEGGPLGLVGRAKQLRDISGGRIADSMAEILVKLHNKRRSANRLPEWGAA